MIELVLNISNSDIMRYFQMFVGYKTVAKILLKHVQKQL